MSLEDNIAAEAHTREGSGTPSGPLAPLHRRDAYDTYTEVHALVRDVYERAVAPR